MTGKISAVSLAIVCAVALAGGVRADVKISTKATQNMSCSGGVCTPTAKKAVLNVTDLANMLAGGDIAVQSGSTAQDIEIDAALSWTSTHRLTLDAYRSITFNKPVTVAGTGALTITTNDGGSGGDFRFFGKGHAEFWDTDSDLVINNHDYTLTKSIKDLRLLVRHNNNGFYALAKSINAKGHQYASSPIDVFGGTIEGLGNTISNLTIQASADRTNVAFIGWLHDAGNGGTIRDIGLLDVNITGVGTECVAALVGTNQGPAFVLNSYATGVVAANNTGSIAGGLVCGNQFGTVERSWADVGVSAVGNDVVGGLIGLTEGAFCPEACDGVVDQSYSSGVVSGGDGAMAGGLIGRNLGGQISNSYATGAAQGGGSALVGGLVGSNENNKDDDSFAAIASSYSTGGVGGGSGATLGGLLGQDIAGSGITNSYWDLDTSGISNPHQGAGNIPDDPGITGLSDAQLRSGLPAGFDPEVWKQANRINSGYPYLIAIPPPM